MTYEVRIMWNDSGEYISSDYCDTYMEAIQLKEAYNENPDFYCDMFDTPEFKEAEVISISNYIKGK